ncbi:MAG TPA: chromosomal replication initiator DnaA [Amaricoccus sp.]|nr:chromosomal replication initiator DnaA [Amaricoccus sp.]
MIAPPPRQLVLDLAARPALGRSDFFVSPANALALAQIDAWPAWPGRRLAVAGPEGSGKTHLAHVWAARSQGRLIGAEELPGLDLAAVPEDAAFAVEDADGLFGAAAEEMLFHLCNHLAARGSLLVTGREPPARWPLRLPDLASRLAVAPVARLELPDDDLLAAVLAKLFADRQLVVAPEVVRYLAVRIDRALAAAERVVTAIDRTGLAERRPVSLRLAGDVLAAGGHAE